MASTGQFMINLINTINIICNLRLFKYLERKTKDKTALKDIDRMAERKRNLYPAWLGFITLSSFTFIFIYFFTIYSFPAHIFDSATKALCTGLICDLFHCVITPGVLLLGSQTGKRKIQRMKSLFS